MGRRRRSTPKEKSRKHVTVRLLEREHAGKTTEPYAIMDELVAQHHAHLSEARIAIAWRFGWKANADGIVTLGRCKKGSDLDRELHNFDFVILLNHEAWNKTLNQEQKVALLDHALCHAEVAKDSNGEVKTDENGRTCYRIRKHDIEEFLEIVSRYGRYTAELERFVGAAMQENRLPLFNDETERPPKKNKTPAAPPPVAGNSAAWPEGKVPRRVRLTRDVEGRADEKHQLYAHVEFSVASIVNDAACIRSAAGELNQLHPDAYDVLEWGDVETKDLAVAGSTAA